VGARARVSKGPSSRLSAQESLGAAAFLAPASRLRAAPGAPRGPVAPAPAFRLGAAPGTPRVPVAPAPGSGSSGAATCRLGSSTCLLSQGSSGAVTCPVDMLYKLQAIKQIFFDDPAIMIFIEARECVSTKALRDKGCSTHLQGMQ
jgi:hypothetical protein